MLIQFKYDRLSDSSYYNISASNLMYIGPTYFMPMCCMSKGGGIFPMKGLNPTNTSDTSIKNE